MLLIQMLAADMANVDKIIFHTYDDKGKKAYDEAYQNFV